MTFRFRQLERSERLLLAVAVTIFVSHILFLVSRFYPSFGVLLAASFSALVTFSFLRQYVQLTPSFLFISTVLISIQFTHVILRDINYPFSNIGMFSVPTPRVEASRSLNLYRGDKLLSTNAGFIFSELDDNESKVITRILRRHRNNPEVHRIILETYPGTEIR